jgi:hypothetical protein
MAIVSHYQSIQVGYVDYDVGSPVTYQGVYKFWNFWKYWKCSGFIEVFWKYLKHSGILTYPLEILLLMELRFE